MIHDGSPEEAKTLGLFSFEPRKKLNDRSARQLFSFFYGEDTLNALNVWCIPVRESK